MGVGGVGVGGRVLEGGEGVLIEGRVIAMMAVVVCVLLGMLACTQSTKKSVRMCDAGSMSRDGRADSVRHSRAMCWRPQQVSLTPAKRQVWSPISCNRHARAPPSIALQNGRAQCGEVWADGREPVRGRQNDLTRVRLGRLFEDTLSAAK